MFSFALTPFIQSYLENPVTDFLKGLVTTTAPVTTVPEGVVLYAIGDIHGRMDLLTALMEKIESDAPAEQVIVVFLGDYVDRGYASKDVISYLSNLKRSGWTFVFLMGNHELAMLEYMAIPNPDPAWLNFGGAETLMSYGVMPPNHDDQNEVERARLELVNACPKSHLKFLVELPVSYELGDYFFAHAGVHPDCPLEEQDPADLLWIRDEFLLSRKWLGKVVIHGHTLSEKPVSRANRIGVDTGAYATGCLTAVKLEGANRSFLST